MPDLRNAGIHVTPIAFRDPPLISSHGCHQPYALRSIIEVQTEDGTVGLGESYGTRPVLDGLDALAPALAGLEVTDLNGLWSRAGQALADTEGRNFFRIVGAIEVARRDAFGKSVGRKVCDLLGGRVRESVPFPAYLFYKFARHADGGEPDSWGEALTPEALVEQARRMVGEHGFRALNLKAGIQEPEAEIAGLEALRTAFPDAPLRIDPKGAWHLHTTLELLPRLDGLLEYLEDPTPGIPAMACVQAATGTPLATNMCVVRPSHLPPAIAQDAVRVILSDHHDWGGLRASRELARICEIWGIGLSMHSNSHLGISLAAMTHLAAATPNLTLDCDTHYPWQEEEVIEGGKLRFRDGSRAVPDGPGLGVRLDRTALQHLHHAWREHGYAERDDASELRRHWPDRSFERPRF